MSELSEKPKFTLNGKPLAIPGLTKEEARERMLVLSAKINERYAECFRKLAEND